MPEYRRYVWNGHIDCPFVEMDPTGRYGRYNEVLGKGSSKIVGTNKLVGTSRKPWAILTEEIPYHGN